MSSPPLLLIDNSAWARIAEGVPADVAARVAAWIEARQLVVSLPFLLEAGYSLRNASDHEHLVDRLLALPHAALDAESEQLALNAQRELARSGHHRLPPVDLLIAALAHRHRYGVLHYDRHYDLILERTELRFESVWLV